MSDSPSLGSRDPHLHRHVVAFPWHLSTCYFPPPVKHAKWAVQPLHDADARNQRGVGSCPSDTTLCPPPTLLTTAQSSSMILATGKRKSPSLRVFSLILCWIPFSVHSWKCYPVGRDPDCVLLPDSASFTCKNLPDLSSPPSLAEQLDLYLI